MIEPGLQDFTGHYSQGNGGNSSFFSNNIGLTGEESQKPIYSEVKETFPFKMDEYDTAALQTLIPDGVRPSVGTTEIPFTKIDDSQNEVLLNRLLLQCKKYLEDIIENTVDSTDRIEDEDWISQQNSFALILETLHQMWELQSSANQSFFDTLILIDTACRISAETYLSKKQCNVILEVITRLENGAISDAEANKCADLLYESGIDVNIPLQIIEE